jgi:hypothetical protein
MDTVPNIENTPREVRWSEVGDFDQLDERVSALSVIFGSVINMNDGSMEWCPDDMPPTEQERLAWIWLCNPVLDAALLPCAKGRFRDLLVAYRAGEMGRWWDEGGESAAG